MWDIRDYFNGLLDQTLATRISGYNVTRDGYDRNLTNLERVNNANKSGFRMRTLYWPTDNLEILFTGDWATQDDECCVSDIITYEGPGQLGVTFNDLAEVTGIPLPKANPFDRVVDANEKPVNDTTIWGTSPEANCEIVGGMLSDHVITSLTAYRSYDTSALLDGDFLHLRCGHPDGGRGLRTGFSGAQAHVAERREDRIRGRTLLDQTNDTTPIGPDFLAVNTPINSALRLAADDEGYVNSRNKSDYKTGQALIKLANSESDYGSDDTGFRFAEIPVADHRATTVFEDIQYGEYAVKVFHDANENRKLDFGLMGPKEAYGFSNNARGRFGPPAYDDVKFVLEQKELVVEIEVK